MITDKEAALLRRIDAAETDFYAGLLALTLARYDAAHCGGKRGLSYDEIAEIVEGVYKDMNSGNSSSLEDIL